MAASKVRLRKFTLKSPEFDYIAVADGNTLRCFNAYAVNPSSEFGSGIAQAEFRSRFDAEKGMLSAD